MSAVDPGPHGDQDATLIADYFIAYSLRICKMFLNGGGRMKIGQQQLSFLCVLLFSAILGIWGAERFAEFCRHARPYID